MAEARGFRNSSSSVVENKLKTIKLTANKIERENFTIVDLGLNERGGDGLSSVADSIKVTNV